MSTKLKLFLVNDNKVDHELLQLKLQPLGLFDPFDHAYNGEQAVDKIKEGKEYDVIFMNLQMPLMDGLTSTKKIREMGYTKPIWAWSVLSKASMWKYCREAGMDAYIHMSISGIYLAEEILLGLAEAGLIFEADKV